MIYFWGLLALLALSASTLHMSTFLRKRNPVDVVLAALNLGGAIFAVINMAEVLR